MYNTIGLRGAELRSAWARTTAQKDIILGYFHLHPEGAFTPSELLERLIKCSKMKDNTPITSVRRAMTDLTEESFLTKTDSMRTGPYGSNEHIWILKENQGRLF